MGNWFLTIDLADLWQDEDLPFEEKRDAICNRIRSSNWAKLTPYPGHLNELVNAVGATENTGSFDAAFNELYDLADSDGVWFETMAVKK